MSEQQGREVWVTYHNIVWVIGGYVIVGRMLTTLDMVGGQEGEEWLREMMALHQACPHLLDQSNGAMTGKNHLNRK